jgi:LuxR family maltose regulon positive regulatory protein
MVEFLRTKLFIPRTRGNLVSRPPLADLLNTGLDKKFTLITTPAGFIKTTLVLTTRVDPALPLARLRARYQLTEIKA